VAQGELAYDARLASVTLTIFIRALFSFQRCLARRLGIPTTRAATSGTVTFVQRFGSERKLTPHFHTLLPDGVSVHDPKDPGEHPLSIARFGEDSVHKMRRRVRHSPRRTRRTQAPAFTAERDEQFVVAGVASNRVKSCAKIPHRKKASSSRST
jgi:hypothetical protein